jgi:hypothetical protein
MQPDYFLVKVAGTTQLVSAAATRAQVFNAVAKQAVTVNKAGPHDVAAFFEANPGKKATKLEDLGAAANDDAGTDTDQKPRYGGTDD